MIFHLSAACGCSIGHVRKNNEDNFYFDGASLTEENNGLNGIISKKHLLESEICFAVFDGMGGEEYGEKASFSAVDTMRKRMSLKKTYVSGPRMLLQNLCTEMNRSVCERQQELHTSRMGTTAAILLFVPDEVYACNLGDSRIYRLRDNEFSQVSVDDVEKQPPEVRHKPYLTQHLGIPEEDLTLEPHILKCELKKGDIFLICSDGLTDMMTNMDICETLRQHISVKRMVKHLINGALRNGGRDNTTVIVVAVD